MAVRIRRDGHILCAAMHEENEGDLYVNDGLHYYLSVEVKMLITEPHERHQHRGEWWWKGQQPADIVIDPFYLDEGTQRMMSKGNADTRTTFQ